MELKKSLSLAAMASFTDYLEKEKIVSLDNNCSFTDEISVLECEKMLIQEFGFSIMQEQRHQRGPIWRYLLDKTMLTISIIQVKADSPAYRLSTEVYGFAPYLSLTIRPAMSYTCAVSSGEKEIKVVDFLIRHTKGDFGFSSQFHTNLIVRKGGDVYVRDDYEKYLRTEDLANHFNTPFEYKRMTP
jgi:hypothetical protein